MPEIIVYVYPAALFLIGTALFFVLRRSDRKKYSYKTAEETINRYNRELNSITNERLESAREDAIKICDRFNSIEGELRLYNSRMDTADELIYKLDNVDASINSTLEKNLKRDELLMQMNSEIEEMKVKFSNGPGESSRAVREIVNQLETYNQTLTTLDRKTAKLAKTVSELANQTDEQITEIVKQLSQMRKGGTGAAGGGIDEEVLSTISTIVKRLKALETRVNVLDTGSNREYAEAKMRIKNNGDDDEKVILD